MPGYKFPIKIPDMTPVKTNVLVGCRRCKNTWSEEMMLPKDGCRINSTSYQYDCCDKCITEDDKSKLRGGV